MNGTPVPNGGFETPTLNANEIRSQPSGATWNFVTVNAGMVRDTPFGNPSAPEGSQAGYVLGQASIYQTATASAGSFTLSLKAAQGGGNGGIHQQIQLTIQSDPFVPPVIKNFIWSGNSIVEERDANNVVTKRFYPQGVQLTQPSTVNLFYDRDHLGSIRELTDSTQAVRARYDYDPYGVRTKLSGDLDADFAYTGHYFHQPSGLNLAPYRGYSASTGKWIGRDPIGENGGINLYAYVENNPSNAFDPLGFDSWYDVAADWFFERGAAGGTRNHPQLYGASHQITRDLMNDPGVQEAREAWNAKGRPNCFSYDYAFGVTDYLHDLFTLNGTGSFLGSYHVAINRCTNGSTRLEVTNTTGWESGTRSAIPGSRANSSLEDMLKGSGFTLNPRSILNDRMRSAPGPGGNFYQLYYWKE